MEPYIIGVDIGTGSVKGVAVNAAGNILSTLQSPYPHLSGDTDPGEQDPEVIWKTFCTCIAKLVAEMKSSPMAIVLSSAMHSLILVDEAHRPLTKMITWADNRAGDIGERIRNSAVGEMLYEQTGTPIHAMAPLPKIVWFRENSPEMFARTAKFISIKEYIWYRIFGVYEVDYSIASATGLMDIIQLRWNENALSVAGIDPARLSNLQPPAHRRNDASPKVMKELGIDSTTSFIIGSSDGVMANLGSFAIEEGVGAITVGTSGAVRVASRRPVYNFEAMTFNYRLDEDMFICGGPTNNGGVVLKWYAETFLQKPLASANDYTALLQKIKPIPPGADGLLFLPYILGERAPLWNSDASGVFFGIRAAHSQAHFTRAVVEGVTLALYNIAESMERAGLVIDTINVSGGFVHSPEWLQVVADVFGKKICLLNTGDASAVGAAYLGLKSMGLIDDYKSLKRGKFRELLPNEENTGRYRSIFRQYSALYQALAPRMEWKLTQT